jgi:hypothetical protein
MLREQKWNMKSGATREQRGRHELPRAGTELAGNPKITSAYDWVHKLWLLFLTQQ